MSTTKSLLLGIARIKPLGALVGGFFQYIPFALPFKVVAQTAHAVCFRHPVPMRPYHLLVIPKRRIETVFDLLVAGHREIVRDILLAAEKAVGTQQGRYKLDANYGRRQEVMQVHFHLTEAGPAAQAAPGTRMDSEPGAAAAIAYSWKEKDGQAVRLTADLEAAPGTASATTLLSRDQIVELLLHTCRSYAQVLRKARGLTLVLEFERAGNQVAWSRCVYFTLEGLSSSPSMSST